MIDASVSEFPTTPRSGGATTATGKAASRSSLSDLGVKYAASRGISRATLERLGVRSDTVFFPEPRQEMEALVFPYFVDGAKAFAKARSIEGKFFAAMKGGKAKLYNHDNVLADVPGDVFFTEGEFDAAALIEAGIPINAVMSLPAGAPEKPANENEPIEGYGYVVEALQAGLKKAKRFIWCGDCDGPGYALRQNMVRVFGAARFAFVEWPEGCKDANDMLLAEGPGALRDLVTNGAQPWPVDGLYRLSDLPEPAPLTLWRPGFAEWESKVMLAPGTMSVVTGQPGHGKTALWTQIWFNIVRAYAVGACVATFETRPKPHMRRNIRSMFIGKLEKEMSDEEKRRADAWIDERYLWLNHAAQQPTLEWVLDRAEVAVIRNGCRILQIDPWNRLESQRTRDETETEYIGRCLTALYVFAQDMNCHVQVLAHPAKSDAQRKNKPPELDDISGSKHWDNRVDQGFVVHRPTLFDGTKQNTSAEMYCRKVRFPELGHPCKLALEYDMGLGRYRSTDYDSRFGGPST